MTLLVRSAALSAYEPLARGLGLDVPALLSRFGLPLQALRDPDLLVSYPAFIELLEHSAGAARCPDFGLRLAQSQGIANLGPVAVLLRQAATVGDALGLASRYLFLHSPALQLTTEAVPGRPHEVRVVFDIAGIDLAVRPQITGLSLGMICHGLQALTGARVRPRGVTVPHAPVAPEAAYRDAFGCAVRFAAPAAAVHIDVSALAVVVSPADAPVKALALDCLTQLGGHPEARLADRVRRVVRKFLGTGRSGHADVAWALSMQPRTLQRRLAEEGVTFERLVDEVRKARFLELIALRAGPGLTQIAHILGYAEASVLTRSCRRWFGVTPKALRRANGPASGPLSRAPLPAPPAARPPRPASTPAPATPGLRSSPAGADAPAPASAAASSGA